MRFPDFPHLFAHLERGAQPRTVAVVGAEDPHALEATVLAHDETCLSPILIGNRKRILAGLERLDRADAFPVLAARTHEEAVATAAALLRDGSVHLLMKGAIPTGTLMHGLMTPEAGFRTGDILSHVSLVSIPSYHKVFAITDAALNIRPDATRKRDILLNAAGVLRRLGMDAPRVAVLAAVDTPNPQMPETLDAVSLREAGERGEFQDCVVDGPLPYDLAMSREAAEAKGRTGPVCGEADILLVPDIACGNVLLKALRYGCGAESAGLVVGGRAPIVLTSRAAQTRDKLLPLRLASLFSL